MEHWLKCQISPLVKYRQNTVNTCRLIHHLLFLDYILLMFMDFTCFALLEMFSLFFGGNFLC